MKQRRLLVLVAATVLAGLVLNARMMHSYLYQPAAVEDSLCARTSLGMESSDSQLSWRQAAELEPSLLPTCQMDNDFDEHEAWLTNSYPLSDPRYGQCHAPVFSSLHDGVFTISPERCPRDHQPSYRLQEQGEQEYTAPVLLPHDVDTVTGWCEDPVLGRVENLHHRLTGYEVEGVIDRSRRQRTPPRSTWLGRVGEALHVLPRLGEPTLRRPQPHELGPLRNVNVVAVIMDAVSRLQFQRSMPTTQRLFERLNRGSVAQVFDFEMYSLTGWHSLENQVPIMLGHDCGGVSHQRFYDHKHAEAGDFTCDHVIWRFFRHRGYATAQFVDTCIYSQNFYPGNEFLEGSCLDLLRDKCGLTEPLHDIMAPRLFNCQWATAIANQSHAGFPNSMRCINVTALYTLAEQALHNYKDTAVPVMATLLSTVGHNTDEARRLQPVADKPTAKFLKSIDLSNTVVIFVADHGLHFGPHLHSVQGQFEHRNPALYAVVPQRILRAYPSMARALRLNQRRLVTSWDVHLTLKHFTSFPGPPPFVTANMSRSLLRPIPANRTCNEAGILPVNCLCNVWRRIPLRGPPPYPAYQPEKHHGHTAQQLMDLAQALLDDHVNRPLAELERESPCQPVVFSAFRRVEQHRIRELDTTHVAIRYLVRLEFEATSRSSSGEAGTSSVTPVVFFGQVRLHYKNEEDKEYRHSLGEYGWPVFRSAKEGQGKAYHVMTFQRRSPVRPEEHLVPDDRLPPTAPSVVPGFTRRMCVIPP